MGTYNSRRSFCKPTTIEEVLLYILKEFSIENGYFHIEINSDISYRDVLCSRHVP